MEIKKFTKYKQEIDWGKVDKFVDKKINDLDVYLKEETNCLDLIEPSCEVQIYPSRIYLRFLPKGILKPKSTTGIDLTSDQEKELKDNLEDISNIVQQTADKFGFRVYGGHLGGHNDYEYEIGYYTFKPNYQEFIK